MLLLRSFMVYFICISKDFTLNKLYPPRGYILAVLTHTLLVTDTGEVMNNVRWVISKTSWVSIDTKYKLLRCPQKIFQSPKALENIAAALWNSPFYGTIFHNFEHIWNGWYSQLASSLCWNLNKFIKCLILLVRILLVQILAEGWPQSGIGIWLTKWKIFP